MPPANDPIAPGKLDYPSQDAALAGAIAWIQALSDSELISDFWFSRRRPQTAAGPDRYYWHATISATVCNGVTDESPAREGRLALVTESWTKAYRPKCGPR